MSADPHGYAALGRGEEELEQALRGENPSRALAETLQRIWPDARLCGAWLADRAARAHVVDERGLAKSEWVSDLERVMRRWRVGHVGERTGSCRTPRTFPFRGDLHLVCMWEGEEVLGSLVVAFASGDALQQGLGAREFLARLADHLTLLLRLERARERGVPSPPGRAHVLADLVGPLCHELHNVFNGVALQAAILARAVPEELRDQVAVFRTQAFRGSAVLGPLDRFRHRQYGVLAEIPVNEAVEHGLAWCREEGLVPDCRLAGQLPSVRADREVLARVVWLLVRNAHAATRPSRGAKVAVRTDRGRDAVVLAVRDNGPTVPRDQLANFFELTSEARGEEEPLERVACQGLVRYLGGVLRAVRLPRKGLEVRADLPVVA